MTNNTDLSWTVSASTDWITVSSFSGTGSYPPIRVTIEPASCPNDESEGTITFTSSQCPGATKTIPITRCVPSGCGESAVTMVYSSFTYSSTVGKCGGNVVVNVPFSSITSYTLSSSCSVCSAVTSASTNPKTITIPISANSENVPVQYEYRNSEEIGDAVITINQEAGPCCNCNDISTSTNSLEWDWNETNQKVVTITCDTCLSITSITSSSTTKTIAMSPSSRSEQCSGGSFTFTATTTDDFIISVSSDKKTITVTPRGQNINTSNNTGTITIKYKIAGATSDCGSKFINLKQYNRNCPTYNLTPNKQVTCEGGIVTFTT